MKMVAFYQAHTASMHDLVLLDSSAHQFILANQLSQLKCQYCYSCFVKSHIRNQIRCGNLYLHVANFHSSQITVYMGNNHLICAIAGPRAMHKKNKSIIFMAYFSQPFIIYTSYIIKILYYKLELAKFDTTRLPDTNTT